PFSLRQSGFSWYISSDQKITIYPTLKIDTLIISIFKLVKMIDIHVKCQSIQSNKVYNMYFKTYRALMTA
ncbi:34057_t:CDS:1, partial [Racocetra persica]